MTATSAATYFVEGLEKNDPDLRSRYFELLRSGGSNTHISCSNMPGSIPPHPPPIALWSGA